MKPATKTRTKPAGLSTCGTSPAGTFVVFLFLLLPRTFSSSSYLSSHFSSYFHPLYLPPPAHFHVFSFAKNVFHCKNKEEEVNKIYHYYYSKNLTDYWPFLQVLLWNFFLFLSYALSSSLLSLHLASLNLVSLIFATASEDKTQLLLRLNLQLPLAAPFNFLVPLGKRYF